MNYPWRLTACLIIAVLFSLYAWFSTIMPNYIAPCHGFLPGYPYRMVVSSMVASPIISGFWSALSLDLWPASGYFAMPQYCTAGDFGAGFPMHWYARIAANAFPAFRISRAMFSGIFAFLLAFFLSYLGRRWWRYLAALMKTTICQ